MTIEINAQDASNLDKILRHLTNSKPGEQFDESSIADVIIPELSVAKAEHYFKFLYHFKPDVIDSITDSKRGRVLCFMVNDYTREFLEDEGGFTAILLEQKKKEDQEEADRELQRINWRTTTQTSKQALAVSIVSAVIAVIAAIIAVFKG